MNLTSRKPNALPLDVGIVLFSRLYIDQKGTGIFMNSENSAEVLMTPSDPGAFSREIGVVARSLPQNCLLVPETGNFLLIIWIWKLFLHETVCYFLNFKLMEVQPEGATEALCQFFILMSVEQFSPELLFLPLESHRQPCCGGT